MQPEVGCLDLIDGTLTASWPLGEGGRKTVTFAEDAIEVSIIHPGSFTENIPLLRSQEPQTAGDTLTVDGQALISFGQEGRAAVEPMDRRVHDKRLWVVSFQAEDAFQCRIGTQPESGPK